METIEVLEKPTIDIDALDAKDFIIVKNARVNNLKGLSVAIPRNKFVVITGVSGSGKSSLAYDTLYAEGQRRYVESLSAYARQFLEKMQKPEVDYIRGIAPAMAINQKSISQNPRSTVGTVTEIYDYLKLLFARVGKTYSPVSGKEVKKHTVSDVVDFFNIQKEETKFLLLIKFPNHEGRSVKEELKVLLQKGFTRVFYKNQILKIEDILQDKNDFNKNELKVLIDRFVVNKKDESINFRISDSTGVAFYEGKGECELYNPDNESHYYFSNLFTLDGILFEEPSVNLFAFNNPYGACPKCKGYGTIIGVDEELVIPNKSLSLYEGAVACWRGEKMKKWNEKFIKNSVEFDFPVHRSYQDLDETHKKLLWEGNKKVKGINTFFKWLEGEYFKIQYRVLASRYMGKTVCNECKGARIRKDAEYVKIFNQSITGLLIMPVSDCLEWFKNIKLEQQEKKIASRLLIEINSRLKYLCDVGLGYLTLNRMASTLSGGESQRIRLATILGSNLVSSMYILDEPSIGLHSRDTHRLIKVLKSLRDFGNTVILVEHDADIIKNSDYIIDIGPEAGANGGKLVFNGNFNELISGGNTITSKYFKNEFRINSQKKIRNWNEYIEVHGASENNLKKIDVKFPLQVMTVVTGVSGSGKSSLVMKVLVKALQKEIQGYSINPGKYNKLSGNFNKIKFIEVVDQNPIGKSSRSNPVTYINAYDEIRKLYSEQQLSKIRGYTPKYFSFNVEGGRCESCEGEGVVNIEMQFMADIQLVCEECKGKRFKQDVLEVTYENKNIFDVLDMTIDEAICFFEMQPRISGRLKVLSDVGLGYVKMGQSSTTLSGGEAQRVKLACYLSKGNPDEHTLYVFDEPTTGLHFHDINKLLKSLNALIDLGNTVIIIEHNTEVIKNADWVIDLGPEGGNEGGNIVFEGTPAELSKCKKSHTGKFLGLV